MRKSRFTDEQVIGFIKQADAGMSVADLCRREGFSSATFYKWRAKFGGMEATRRISGLAGAVGRGLVGGQVELTGDGHAVAPLRLLHRDIRYRVLTVAIRSRRVGSKVWGDRMLFR